jgi:hypothetical protein
MRYSDFKLVEGALSKPTDDKYVPGINQLLRDPNHRFPVGKSSERGILIPLPGQQINTLQDRIQGYMVQNQSETLSADYLQTLKGKNNDQLQSEFKGMTPIMLIAVVDANIPNVSQAAKMELQTRQVGVLATTLFKSKEIKAAIGKTVSDKEDYVVKPSQIFADEKFPASRVFDEVIQNKILQESEIGRHIIELAQQIQSGEVPTFKNIPKEFQAAIRDYAGEYLGVLALIEGVANFPTRDQWYEHLGVENLNDIVIYFPPESNNPLGDSEGYFQNKETGNIILISSKGGKKGAPPSITGLKIPDNLRDSEEYRAEVDVIETLQNLPAFEGPFVALNKIYQYNPDSIEPFIAETLPLSDEDIAMIKDFSDRKRFSRMDVIQLPDRFRKVVGKGPDVKSDATPGGILHYTYSSALLKAVNQNNALPGFEPMAREILQKNFIQIFARPKGDKLTFDVLWPNKDMATGKIELYNKSAATGIKGKLSFSVT